MITFKIAFRNVLRQKRRTLLTVLTMMGGFALASISFAWSDGSYNVIIDMFTRNQLGHIQIHGQGYLDRPTLYNTINDAEDVGSKVASVEGVQSWAPRIFSAGLASVGEKSAGVRIVGIDPARENETTRFDKKIVEGQAFSQSGSYEAILGQGLAEVMKAAIGDEIVVLSQGADGSIANDLYHIVGLVETGSAVTDQTTLYLTLTDIQELLVLYGRVHEIAIVVDELDNVETITEMIKEVLVDPDLAVEPWQEFARAFYTAMKADQQGNWIMLVIIVLIVAVGVLNTVLMTVLERRREYGMLRAIGVRPAQVMRLVMYEVAVMAVISLIIGSVIALGVNYWLSLEGITISQGITYGGVEFRTFYSEINARSFIIPAITVFVAAIIVSLFPAIKAARTAPAKAMRTQ